MRTEQDVLNDFEKLEWKIIENNEDELVLLQSFKNKIGYYLLKIYKPIGVYRKMCIIKNEDYSADIELQEHKLLNELFQIWGWI